MHPERIVPPSIALVVDGEAKLNLPGCIGMNQLQSLSTNAWMNIQVT